MSDDDFEVNTKVIREWLAHRTVRTDALAAELRKWAEWAEAAFQRQTPDAFERIVGSLEAHRQVKP